MDNSARYPYDAGYYLYSKREVQETNSTHHHEVVETETVTNVVTVVEYVTNNIWVYWQETHHK